MHAGRSSSRSDGTNTIPLRVAARVPANDCTTGHLRSDVREGRFCAILFQAVRNSLILKTERCPSG